MLPLSIVEECVELTREDIARAHGRHMAYVRGTMVPYIRLRERFSMNGHAPEIEQIVITDSDGGRAGFVVDKVIGEHQTVLKNLGKMYRDVDVISGATILGDGTVALILDAPQLIRDAETENLNAPVVMNDSIYLLDRMEVLEMKTWFYNLKISNKLVISFLVVSGISVIVGCIGIMNISKIHGIINAMYHYETLGISYIKQSHINVQNFVRAERNFIFATTAEKRETSQKLMNKYENDLKGDIDRVKTMVRADRAKELTSKFDRAWEEFREVNRKVIDLAVKEGLTTEKNASL